MKESQISKIKSIVLANYPDDDDLEGAMDWAFSRRQRERRIEVSEYADIVIGPYGVTVDVRYQVPLDRVEIAVADLRKAAAVAVQVQDVLRPQTTTEVQS